VFLVGKHGLEITVVADTLSDVDGLLIPTGQRIMTDAVLDAAVVEERWQPPFQVEYVAVHDLGRLVSA
jgi:hypothetical protein